METRERLLRILHVDSDEDSRRLVRRIAEEELRHIVVSEISIERAEDRLYEEKIASEGKNVAVLSEGGRAAGVSNWNKTTMFAVKTYLAEKIRQQLALPRMYVNP